MSCGFGNAARKKPKCPLNCGQRTECAKNNGERGNVYLHVRKRGQEACSRPPLLLTSATGGARENNLEQRIENQVSEICLTVCCTAALNERSVRRLRSGVRCHLPFTSILELARGFPLELVASWRCFIECFIFQEELQFNVEPSHTTFWS